MRMITRLVFFIGKLSIQHLSILNLNSATKLSIPVHHDGTIHRIPSLKLQEEQPRALRLLHVQNVLDIEVMLGKNTVPVVLETSPQEKAGDPAPIRQSAIPIVQRDQFRLEVERNVRVHLDHGSRSEENGRARLVSAHHHVRVMIPIQVKATGHREPESVDGNVQILGVDRLRIFFQNTG